MAENQKLREALHKAKAALSLALSDVDWRKDSLTQPVIHKAYNCAHEALAMPTAEQVDDINVAESFTSVTKTAEPVGDLPELPEPFALSVSVHEGDTPAKTYVECQLFQKHPNEKQKLYTVDQMRAYAREAMRKAKP